MKNKIRENTFNSYEYVLKRVREKLGQKRLCDIQAFEIQELYNSIINKGLSSRIVRYTHTVLSSALRQAVKWKMIMQNPCDLCELPRLEKAEMQCFTPEETTKFLETAKTDKFYALFYLAIETGMRPEEFLGLQWKDLDFEKKTISVKRALIEKKGGGFSFTEPKTKKSRRNIPLSNSLIGILKTHRRKQLEERLKLGANYENLDLIFASEIGTPMQRGNILRRHFKPIRDKADLPKIRLYDLRHTCATLLLAAGENPKVVAERLGHASIVLTLDTYSHVLPTMQKEATDKLEKIMFRK